MLSTSCQAKHMFPQLRELLSNPFLPYFSTLLPLFLSLNVSSFYPHLSFTSLSLSCRPYFPLLFPILFDQIIWDQQKGYKMDWIKLSNPNHKPVKPTAVKEIWLMIYSTLTLGSGVSWHHLQPCESGSRILHRILRNLPCDHNPWCSHFPSRLPSYQGYLPSSLPCRGPWNCRIQSLNLIWGGWGSDEQFPYDKQECKNFTLPSAGEPPQMSDNVTPSPFTLPCPFSAFPASVWQEIEYWGRHCWQ